MNKRIAKKQQAAVVKAATTGQRLTAHRAATIIKWVRRYAPKIKPAYKIVLNPNKRYRFWIQKRKKYGVSRAS